MRRALLIALLAALLLPTAASAMRNPVVPETAAGDDTPDPWLFRHADRYWLTYTTAGRIELRSARTLTGLAGATPRKLWPPDGVVEPEERCCEIWAPEIHRLTGPDGRPRWYVYYAANGHTFGTHRMYVLESEGDSPAGPYRDRGRLDLPEPFAIDGTVFEDRGRRYLIYSAGDTFAPASLRLVELSNPWTVASAPVVISEPTLPWEQATFAINEGPEVLTRDGLLHVIYSASWCGSGHYAMGRLTVPADADLLDPATWRDAKVPEPVFAGDPARGVWGPGHGSFFTSPDGREHWMVYHATEEEKGCFTGGLRTVRAQPFTWRADGTPDFGAPAPLSQDLPAPSGDGSVVAQAETVVRRARGARATTVSDRRLHGYEGLRLAPARGGDRLATLRVRVPRGGRYRVVLDVLGQPGAGPVALRRSGRSAVRRSARAASERLLALPFGTLRLRRGVTRLTLSSDRPLTVDQLRLERAR